MEVRTQVQVITPDLARQYLEKNKKDNRKLRKSNVKRFTEQIIAGEFILTHQGIAFDETGNLIDGQHRLNAIIDAGKPVEMNVTVGLSTKAFAVTDQGVKRTPADILNCSQRVAEVSTLALRMIKGVRGSAILSPDELMTIHEKLVAETAELLAINPTVTVYFSSSPVRLAAVTRILAGENKAYIHDLYGKLVRAEVSSLPPIASLWVGQHMKGKLKSADKLDTLARALYCLDETKADSGRIREIDPEAARAYVCDVLNSI